MDYMIIVNDNGELKTISAAELDSYNSDAGRYLEGQINGVLDMKSARAALAELNRRLDTHIPQRVADDTEHANRGQR